MKEEHEVHQNTEKSSKKKETYMRNKNRGRYELFPSVNIFE